MSIATCAVDAVTNVLVVLSLCVCVTVFAPMFVMPVKLPDSVSPALFAGVYPSAVVTSEEVSVTAPVLVLNDRIPLLVIVYVPEETDVAIEFVPLTANVPPPDTVPEPVFATRLIVVEIELFEAEVTLPRSSTVIVGINVAEPYVPADTPDVARSIATAPEVKDCVILEEEFEVNDVTGVSDEIVVVLPYAST